MFEISKFNMDKFIHTFMENLGLRIEACKKFNKITFVTSIDKSHIMQLYSTQLYSTEEMKEINVQQCLDFPMEKNIEYFIEKHAKLFDKFTYLNNAQILTSHLKNINTKLLQRIRIKRKHDGTIRKGEMKAWNKIIKLKTNLANKLNEPKCNSLSSLGCKQKYVNSYNCKRNKFKKGAVMGNLNLLYDNTASNDHKKDSIVGIDNDNQTSFLRRSLSNIMLSTTTNKQLEITEKFLWLHIKDVEYIKRNIEIILHVAKNTKYNYTKKNHTNYDQILCYHAILCLIEPSKKSAVLMEDNLPVVIKKYLIQGYRYHFDFQRRFNNVLNEIKKKMVNEEVVEFNKKSQPVYKNPIFQQKFRSTSATGKKRTWRSLKQMLAQERSLPWPAEVVHYSSINAPPSFRPAKKYSDISGLPARYTDPQTKLYYATAEEFATVRSLPMDITAGYLALRGASSIVG